jgi:hypothetical protein
MVAHVGARRQGASENGLGTKQGNFSGSCETSDGNRVSMRSSAQFDGGLMQKFAPAYLLFALAVGLPAFAQTPLHKRR